MKNTRKEFLKSLIFPTILSLIGLVFAIVVNLIGIHIAHGAVIDPHLTSPFYITVVAEKGDTAYSIAKLFTPRGQSVMPVATAFVVLNNLKYNRKGNPVVHARRLYAFPTQLSRDRMQELARSLNTASRDWYREHYMRMHGTTGMHQMMGANAHHAGPSVLEKTDAAGKGDGGADVSASETKAGEDIINPILAFLSIALTIVLIIFSARDDYQKHVAKSDVALALSTQPIKEPHGTSAPFPAPDEKKGEANGVSEGKVIPQSVAKPEVAPTSEEKSPVQVATGTDTPSPAPDEKKEGQSDPRERRAIPLVYQDPQDPYEDPSAPTGLTLGEKFVNIFRAYTLEEVAEALEHDVIPVAALQNMKMTVKYVKIRNIPESVRKHPEWKNQNFHNLITAQEKMLRDIKKNEPVEASS